MDKGMFVLSSGDGTHLMCCCVLSAELCRPLCFLACNMLSWLCNISYDILSWVFILDSCFHIRRCMLVLYCCSLHVIPVLILMPFLIASPYVRLSSCDSMVEQGMKTITHFTSPRITTGSYTPADRHSRRNGSHFDKLTAFVF